jgi:hypothetical protein
MVEVMLLALALQQPHIGSDAFNVEAELQGMYEEISQATLQFGTVRNCRWLPMAPPSL